LTKRKPRPERPRAQARRSARAGEKLARDQERLFCLSPGGSAARPLPVPSASVVESRALAERCPGCGGQHEILEHAAVTSQGRRLREVRLRCRQCARRRSLFFELEDTLLN
jgi:hypothetical protein